MRASSEPRFPNHDNAPIGVFDSGYGGLTVLREIIARMPQENFIFIGDSARCPYGPRHLDEVKGFTVQICSYLVSRGCKLIVIACNTATAAGLKEAQRIFDVPIIGVVEPGARAAVHVTRARRVGVIATEGTIRSNVYERAIHNIDAGIKVFSVPTPEFVNIAEAGVQFDASGGKDAPFNAEYSRIALEYLRPLRLANIDTLVLGCTHFPLIEPLIQESIGEGVSLVSSAEETARDVAAILQRRGQLASGGNAHITEFFTTLDSTEEFMRFGSIVMDEPIASVGSLVLPD